MSLRILHNETEFGVGDRIRVHQKVKEREKERTQIFEGIVLAIKNRQEGRSVTLRRIGAANIGIERIFSLASPFMEKIEVVKRGTSGVRHAKLYFIRKKSPSEVEEIYSRAARREARLTQKKKITLKRKNVRSKG
ncbi:50S ribosomal protein L19 [Candidatus Woesebacteria bacterium]|nr:50S ribosomal protein L19 [Candidatus Woesebacteria bacterium]